MVGVGAFVRDDNLVPVSILWFPHHYATLTEREWFAVGIRRHRIAVALQLQVISGLATTD